jgi:hypothetical protein
VPINKLDEIGASLQRHYPMHMLTHVVRELHAHTRVQSPAALQLHLIAFYRVHDGKATSGRQLAGQIIRRKRT